MILRPLHTVQSGGVCHLPAQFKLKVQLHSGIAPCEYIHRTVPKGPPSHLDEVVARLFWAALQAEDVAGRERHGKLTLS